MDLSESSMDMGRVVFVVFVPEFEVVVVVAVVFVQEFVGLQSNGRY
jgi:hypothetical protein